ncbi:hypothetical protein [Desulfosporosinus sp. BICA1-9]|nr:hypothetical protein [Desulfosporosinus sp. BICA1-9]
MRKEYFARRKAVLDEMAAVREAELRYSINEELFHWQKDSEEDVLLGTV